MNSRDVAIEAHGEQLYGDKGYVVHLDAVVAILTEYGFTDQVYVDSGYLHDTIEDTELTYDEIEAKFGTEVADIIFACSGVGSNRKERTASILAKIAGFVKACVVKASDRIANAEEAKANKPGLYQMYKREMPAFIEVVAPHIPDAMLIRLEAI